MAAVTVTPVLTCADPGGGEEYAGLRTGHSTTSTGWDSTGADTASSLSPRVGLPACLPVWIERHKLGE
ncbi:hypothetical protein SKAU_G00029860 [Synaphobranchus kaupii]|uniref:Uncharacterized protein n=1 Tax=Synaphobranchus kaupii TaxID=118154 RepID=A0A9Q1GEH0_SYNKA|nr:hypothetical protein SKAU_G00029860 [Synaphobranchus kaupii]